jgi:hypothetical protein
MLGGSTICPNLELTVTVDAADHVPLGSTSNFPHNHRVFYNY